MAAAPQRGKLYSVFTLSADNVRGAGHFFTRRSGGLQMVGIAIVMFIAVFGWGSHYFGWEDPDGKVQLALGTCFILGVLCGYKVKN
jgi:hypothetical protein